ncbi:hypothetical protein EDB84DRAFT_1485368 [Lactarius hengduanensis]|nr:hypothetical protein EDB84DRAFT_1485368 [Lactarius hengduanensis]
MGEHNTAAFFPFSYGPTNCEGKNLALMEILGSLLGSSTIPVFRVAGFPRQPGVIYEEWEGRALDRFVVHQDPC